MLEEKLRDLTNDESALWEGLSIKDLEMVEPTTIPVPATTPSTPSGSLFAPNKLLTHLFRSKINTQNDVEVVSYRTNGGVPELSIKVFNSKSSNDAFRQSKSLYPIGPRR